MDGFLDIYFTWILKAHNTARKIFMSQLNVYANSFSLLKDNQYFSKCYGPLHVHLHVYMYVNVHV